MPNKAVSKQQFKFMKGVQSGNIKAKGLSPDKAAEMTMGQQGKSYQALPDRAESGKQMQRKRQMKKKKSKKAEQMRFPELKGRIG